MAETQKRLRLIVEELDRIAGKLEDAGFTDVQCRIDGATTTLDELLDDLESL